MSDSAALLVRVGQGDEAAFSDLYDDLAPLVHGVVRKVVRDPSMSAEVSQEVFVEIWRIASRFDPAQGSARGWAATIAHRKAVDFVRSEQARRTREDNEHRANENMGDVVAADVEKVFERHEVKQALSELSPPQYEAIALAYFGGHTYREVATILGIAEGTAKTRIRDGLKRLRTEMVSLS